MAHWGIACAIGPNSNQPWKFFEPDEKAETLKRAHRSIDAVMALREKTIPVEAASMRKIHGNFPGDLEASSFFTEAPMSRTPWMLWGFKKRRACRRHRDQRGPDGFGTCLRHTARRIGSPWPAAYANPPCGNVVRPPKALWRRTVWSIFCLTAAICSIWRRISTFCLAHTRTLSGVIAAPELLQMLPEDAGLYRYTTAASH